MSKSKYLLVLDFDGTIAETFKPSPNEIGVNEAYCMAIQDLFGHKGLEQYNKSGGLQNRNPGEVVCSLVSQGFDKTVNAEQLVQKKLEYLLAEIGPDWPKPCRGFVSFYRDVEEMGGLEVAILSSGHREFIKKTFSVWGLDPPRIMLTDDDLRGYNPPLPLEKASKPSAFLLSLLHWDWGGDRQHMIMFGDDPKKDGGMAINFGIPFGLYSPNFSGNFMENSFQFSDWREISDFLKKKTVQKMISKKLSTSKIIFPNTC